MAIVQIETILSAVGDVCGGGGDGGEGVYKKRSFLNIKTQTTIIKL